VTDVLVIAGLSGAGRSQAADDIEDLGWFVIDNLPCNINQLWATIPNMKFWNFIVVVGLIVLKSKIT
jgi:RNase adaptor protein for sRNA GlmZ degradation